MEYSELFHKVNDKISIIRLEVKPDRNDKIKRLENFLKKIVAK